MRKPASDTHLDIDTLTKELERIVGDVNRLAHSVSKTFETARGKAREGYSGAVDLAAHLEEPVREGLEFAEQRLEAKVKERPLASLALAFVAGMVISALVWR